MPRSETTNKQSSAPAQAAQGGAPITVSGRWILTGMGFTIVAAAVCGWLTLCLLFWQGGWQLLYHPTAAITRTPASAGIAFDAIAFASTDTGQPTLAGWWIPVAANSPHARFTVLYLHGASGSLSNCVDALAQLHAIGVNVFAFDYRGYGQSQFAHPNETRMREDVDAAFNYLTGTRHIAAGSIVLYGEGLGADLALETAAARGELAGVILESPLASPADSVFNDARARLVPARLLVHDRYDVNDAAQKLRVPSLWIVRSTDSHSEAAGYALVSATKLRVTLDASANDAHGSDDAVSKWLDGLRVR